VKLDGCRIKSDEHSGEIMLRLRTASSESFFAAMCGSSIPAGKKALGSPPAIAGTSDDILGIHMREAERLRAH